MQAVAVTYRINYVDSCRHLQTPSFLRTFPSMSFELYSTTIPTLIVKHLLNDLSTEERQQLDAWIMASDTNWLTFQEVTNTDWLALAIDHIKQYDKDKAFEKIKTRLAEI